MNYFVTGATGFIGRFLVTKLLDRGGKVFVLVREGSVGKLDALREYWGADSEQVVAVIGDLSKTKLGVGNKWIKEHAGQIDHFYHLAAIYDMEADAESQRLSNVEGTRQALALGRALKVGCFHQVSSIAAAGLYKGTFSEDMFDEATNLDHPYFATKHESEGLVRKEKKIPWRIYRPGMVVGHSETGEMDKIDGPYYFFNMIKNISKVAPRWLPLLSSKAGLFNIVPVDFVVDAIDHLGHLPDADNRCFFVVDPQGIRLGDLLNELFQAAHGPSFNSVNLPWIDSAMGVATKLTNNSLTASAIKRMGVPPEAMAFLNYPTRFDADETTAILAEGGISCPPFGAYAEALWIYWEQYLAESSGSSMIDEVDRVFNEMIGRPGLRALRKAVDGKVVVVTGATSGIGKECALRLAEGGATVLLVARTPEKLEDTLKEIAAKGGTAEAYPCDVSDMEDCDRLVKQILDDHQRVDVLVNNAGRSIRRSVRYSYDRFHDFERTMQLNYFGALRLITGFLPSMELHREGHIINISSIGVLTSPPRFSAYVASKSALDAFSQCAAPEYAENNIHFTTIHMPLVRTPMIAPTSIYKAFPTLSPEQARDLVIKAIIDKPKRLSTGLGIAGAVAQATLPGITEAFLSQAYSMFPDSAAARGLSEEEAAKERANIPSTKKEIARRLFVQMTKGMHW